MSPAGLPHPWDAGSTPSFAYQQDPRFSYWLHVPRNHLTSPAKHRRLLVAVHGTERNAPLLRSLFAEFSERTGVVILAPHFPGGIGDPRDVHGYKYIRANGVHYDEVLLGMIDEVAHRYGIDRERVLMFGFSGGAHFAHRFWYLHPERLRALTVAAPGSVTLPDMAAKWWVGVGDMQEKFGRALNLAAMRAVRALLVVGEQDTAVDVITHTPASPYWLEGANRAGKTRVERLRYLHDMMSKQDIDTRLRELPGVTHEYRPLVLASTEFFEEVVEELRGRQ